MIEKTGTVKGTQGLNPSKKTNKPKRSKGKRALKIILFLVVLIVGFCVIAAVIGLQLRRATYTFSGRVLYITNAFQCRI